MFDTILSLRRIFVLMSKFYSNVSTHIIFTFRKQVREQLTINSSMFELPSRDVVVEEQVDLAKCAVFRLREAEPAPDEAKKVGAGIEETSFGSPVPG
jgi:hypothetical protein